MKSRVLVAISHPQVASGVIGVLSLDPRFEVLSATPADAGAAAREWRAELVLADAPTARQLHDLGERLVVTAAGDGLVAQATAEQVHAAGWIFVDEVAERLASFLPKRERVARPAVGAGAWAWVLLLTLGAVALRVGYLAVGTDDPHFTGWYTDSFHHWQIAYLTKEIGFSQGRLWDLGGVEYFWGFIPTVLDALLLTVSFTTTLWPLQVLNLVAGSAAVGVLYLVGRRYWSHRVGLIVALFVAVNPVSVFTDVSGMQEPVALLFLSLALLWFLDRPARAGLMLGLAAASRPDYWAYSLAILGSAALILGGLRPRPPFVRLGAIAPYLRGYAIVVVPYMLILWMQTGNPIYPLYWNFLGNARGQWLADIQPTEHQLGIQAIARILLVASLAGQALVARSRPRGWPVLVAGLWGATLIGFLLGLSKYILAYLDRFWIDRIMLLLYLLVAVLVALALTWLERTAGVRRLASGTALGVLAALALNALWVPTLFYRDQIRAGYDRNLDFGAQVASLAREGTVIVPGAAVHLTYAMVQHGVGARRLLSANYHPDYTPEAPDEFLAWLRRYDVRWMVIAPGDLFYEDVARHEPTHFALVRQDIFAVYAVTP